MRFAQNLEPVADADDQSAIFRVFDYRLHRRREPRDCAGAQIIAVAETAGHDDAIHVAERVVLVPDIARRLTKHVGQHMVGVLIAIAAGKLDDSKLHTFLSSDSTDYHGFRLSESV